MKLNLLKKSGLLFFSAVLLLPCLTRATILGTIDMAYSSFGAYEYVMITSGIASGTPAPAGVVRFKSTSATGEGQMWNNGPITGFCIELAEPRRDSLTTYNVLTPPDGPVTASSLESAMGTGKAKYLSELWGRYYDPSWSTGDTFTSTQNSQAAIFGAAVWEIVHENFTGNPLDWDVSTAGTPGSGFGSYAVDYMTANTWLHSLDGTGPMANLRVLSSSGNQDFLVAVPEPATIAILGIGGMFSLMRRKKIA
jgi:hypothetical protein